jgi:hypothetical protein
MDPLGVKMIPIFDLTPFSQDYITMIVYESVKKGTLHETIDDVQAILKVLETPAYKLAYPNYTKADLQLLVVKFTAIFKALLTEKARLI